MTKTVTCEVCQSPFEYAGKKKYCSSVCAELGAVRRGVVYREKNRELLARKKKAWATANRPRIRERRRLLPRPLSKVEATCRHCGTCYRPKEPDRNTFCSRECAYTYKRSLAKYPPKQGRVDDYGSHRRRARRFGVGYEPVKRQVVLARDSWLCGLCGEPIDRRACAPEPLSATLDHIVPMSKGGSHSYANVQAAHFTCNLAKGGLRGWESEGNKNRASA